MKRVAVVIPMYNATGSIIELIESLCNQQLSVNVELDIIVVDDGSSDNSAALVSQRVSSVVRLVSHGVNRGRAAARNTGARAANGDYLLFLDADCRIGERSFVMRHVQVLERGADVSVGVRSTVNNSFLAAFESSVNRRRAIGPVWTAFTSANFAIRQTVFEKCGGFDERYRWYGFEDRDLAVRLVKSDVQLVYSVDAVVYHEDVSTAGTLLRRTEEAGKYSSELFMRDHPDYYKQLVYSRLDFRLHPFRCRILYLVYVVLYPMLRPVIDWILNSGPSVFGIKAFVFRFITALTFVAGTRRS